MDALALKAFRKDIKACTMCDLHAKSKHGPVPSAGLLNSKIMLVGEAPGKSEKNEPFVGNAGRELEMYLSLLNMHRSQVYITNVVKCNPPNNRNPKPSELIACRTHLDIEIMNTDARVIVAMGAVAASVLLNRKVRMETIHGIPEKVTYECSLGDFRPAYKKEIIVFPVFHPAAGLHNKSIMQLIFDDFRELNRFIANGFKSRLLNPVYTQPMFFENRDIGLEEDLAVCDYIAIDTETTADGKPWSIQYSYREGEGRMFLIDKKNRDNVVYLQEHLFDVCMDSGIKIVLHNAKFDLDVLERAGFYVDYSLVEDTMVYAYVIGNYPQGLKDLGYRLFGIRMQKFSEVVKEATSKRYTDYLIKAKSIDWPKPEPYSYTDTKGEVKVKRPQGVATKIKRLFTDIGKNPDINIVERYNNFLPEEKEMLEKYLGPITRADLRHIEWNKAVFYACQDSDITLRATNQLVKIIERYGLQDVAEVDNRINIITYEMEQIGMKVDIGRLKKLSKYYQEKMDEIEREIESILGYYVNPGSANQVSEALYNKLKIKPPNRTKGGKPSTDADTLKLLENIHPVAKKIVQWRQMQKNKSTFADGIQKWVDKRDRIHANIKTTRTVTGRLAASNPNLLAIPKHTEEGKKIRECFIPRKNCFLCSNDFSQIEFRDVADQSGDPTMIKVFIDDLDLHTQTAMKIFGLPESEIDREEHRFPAKTAGFGILYQISAAGLYDQLVAAGCKGWTVDRCADLIKEWFSIYRGVHDFFGSKKIEARRKGYVTDRFGKIYWVPQVKSLNPYIRAEGERLVCSYPIQGGAQGIMKRAMLALQPLYKKYQTLGYTAELLLQIHDDLISEISEDIVGEFMAEQKHIMENCVKLKVPLKVEGEKGKSWAEI